ncbi:Protein of unknown function [Asanoa hainanensis]|uniref:Uncharacterized protein n=1 Tax=Asanoa hainanensis TaxID=560556 RepID=A0A239PEP7_9ACTN|nr:Protein of unknown function [Asanoa hainanensis]
MSHPVSVELTDSQGVTISLAHIRFPRVQVTSTRFLPLLVSTADRSVDEGHVLDEFTEGIAVAYSFGPPFGERLVSWSDLDRMAINRRTLRRVAIDHLYDNLRRAQIHGRPPALMLSFEGLESSVLLAEEFWDEIAPRVPGELVVGVPARDVVIITGSESPPGLNKARRAIERVFMAGDQHPISRELLVWRQGEWQPLLAGRRPGPRPPELGWNRAAATGPRPVSSAPDPAPPRWQPPRQRPEPDYPDPDYRRQPPDPRQWESRTRRSNGPPR